MSSVTLSEQPSQPNAILPHVATRLSQFGAARETTLTRLYAALGPITSRARGTDVTAALAGAPCIITSGWACQMHPDFRSRRQIFGFYLPGDVIGSFWRRTDYVFWRLSALTRLTMIGAGGLLAIDEVGQPMFADIVDAARRAEDHSQHLLFDHLTRLGARDAYAGLAHLLLELHDRLARVGMALDGGFQLPIGQRVLAQIMGLSLVHTNHTLQRMTADGLFSIRGAMVQLHQPDKMAILSDFSLRPIGFSDQPLSHAATA